MTLTQNYVPPTTTPMTGEYLELTPQMDCLIGAGNAFESFLCTNFWFGIAVFIMALFGSIVLLALLLRWAKKSHSKKPN